MRDYFEPTIKRYLRRWRPTQRPSTIHSKKSLLRRFVAYLHEHHPEVRRFSQIQRDPHIEGWLESMLHLSAVSRNAAVRTLRLFCEDLNAWQWPNPPPLNLLSNEDLAPEPLVLPRPLPPELDQAVQKAFIEAGTFAAMGLLLLRYTGMRIGEMRALPLNAMEPAGPDTFSLRVPVGKTYAERLIPLDERTVDLVRRIIAQRARLQNRRLPPSRRRLMMIDHWGRHLSSQSFCVHIKDLTAHLDPTEHITCHRLRHCFATEMARAGMPVPALMKLLGHKTPKMTMRYVQVAQNDVRDAYDQAMSQLTVIRSVQSRAMPSLPVSAAALPQHTDSNQLLKLMEAMITCLESHRRDQPDLARSKQLHRFIKRMRKAGYDLRNIL
jgi:site-specific recombinase XerD